jgi:hypothetical protein
MKCINCPALCREGYEYPEEYCFLGEEDIEFKDGSIGCHRKSISKIKRDLKIAREIDAEAFAYEAGRMVKYFDELKKKYESEG